MKNNIKDDYLGGYRFLEKEYITLKISGKTQGNDTEKGKRADEVDHSRSLFPREVRDHLRTVTDQPDSPDTPEGERMRTPHRG
ncbi:MAG: hypothetical protein OXF02_03350 [Simkaniaceae bacterium]|nr:hypothetical protein [Simkaniaceae bacterium]